ncbi:MAG: hypothetical protein ACOYBJ_01150 [Patescibacteria group bacterium]|jgi:hypothetical protein
MRAERRADTLADYRNTQGGAIRLLRHSTDDLLVAFLPTYRAYKDNELVDLPGILVVDSSAVMVAITGENRIYRSPCRAYDGKRYPVWEQRVEDEHLRLKYAAEILSAFTQLANAAQTAKQTN